MTKERSDIGRQVYEHLLTKEEAARKYGVSVPCIYAYIREYMISIGIEPLSKGTKRVEPTKDYRSMTKDEFINELMLKVIEAARAKKGYAVKGGGRGKEKRNGGARVDLAHRPTTGRWRRSTAGSSPRCSPTSG